MCLRVRDAPVAFRYGYSCFLDCYYEPAKSPELLKCPELQGTLPSKPGSFFNPEVQKSDDVSGATAKVMKTAATWYAER